MKEKDVLKQIKDQKTAEYVLECIQKARNWDKLGKEIESFYINKDGNPIEDDGEDEGLIGIGECAASAYGWI